MFTVNYCHNLSIKMKTGIVVFVKERLLGYASLMLTGQLFSAQNNLLRCLKNVLFLPKKEKLFENHPATAVLIPFNPFPTELSSHRNYYPNECCVCTCTEDAQAPLYTQTFTRGACSHHWHSVYGISSFSWIMLLHSLLTSTALFFKDSNIFWLFLPTSKNLQILIEVYDPLA